MIWRFLLTTCGGGRDVLVFFHTLEASSVFDCFSLRAGGVIDSWTP